LSDLEDVEQIVGRKRRDMLPDCSYAEDIFQITTTVCTFYSSLLYVYVVDYAKYFLKISNLSSCSEVK
jgi:hypothetical protein